MSWRPCPGDPLSPSALLGEHTGTITLTLTMVAHQPLVNGPRRGFLAPSLARSRPRLPPAEVRAARQGEHRARRPLAAASRPLLPHLAPARPLAAPHAAPGHPGRRALGSTPHGRRAGAWSDGERRGTDGAASARIGGGRLGELRQLGWGCRRAALCWRTAPRRRRRQPLTLLYVVDTLLPCTGERGAVRPASPRPRHRSPPLLPFPAPLAHSPRPPPPPHLEPQLDPCHDCRCCRYCRSPRSPPRARAGALRTARAAHVAAHAARDG